jgi:branched-chain amino acid transport system substrate-binding protein
VIFDYTGPLAAGGSEAGAIGTKIAIDMINERGGVEGNKINAIFADAQSKPEVAVNEAERLLNSENVDLLMGVYSSAQCVPLAAKVDAQKDFFWANICVSSAVFKNRNLKYVFRAQVHSDTYGTVSPDFLAAYSQERFGIDPKDLKLAIIHEDGPYGSGMASGNEVGAERHGMKVVLKEGYSDAVP